MTYNTIHAIPTPSPSVHLAILNVNNIANIFINNVSEVTGNAVLCTGTAVSIKTSPLRPCLNINIIDFNSHGIPKQNRMSNILEPIELQIAISTSPDFFTNK